MSNSIRLHLNQNFTPQTIRLPASKSISNRAVILNALSYSPYKIDNLSTSDDTKSLVTAFDSNSNHFDVGAAGTTMRFLTAFLAKTLGEWTITGSERMKQRPIKILVKALNQIGGKIEYIEKKGFPPLKIYGSALLGGEITLDGSVSSQYISALLMIAPYTLQGVTINIKGELISVPYIEMTIKMMETFGIKTTLSTNRIVVKPQQYTPIKYTVEPDWSAASYWYSIVAIARKGKVMLSGLAENSLQGDSKIAILFRQLGVETTFNQEGAQLSASVHTCTHLEYNFINEPDMAQTFVVCCCAKNITFHFSGLSSLKIKETDRIAALITELKKCGYQLSEPTEGELAWEGDTTTPEKEIKIDTYHDHRMAMAFAPIALKKDLFINNPEVVSKSYPHFWDDLQTLAKI